MVACGSALPRQAAPKEATVDQSIIELGQDLARAGYAKTTQKKYVRVAEHLGSRFGRPVAEIDREQLREYVDELGARGKSAQWVIIQIAALRFCTASERRQGN